MGLFSDMAKFGLGKYENTDIYEDKKKNNASDDSKVEKVEKKEEDYLYDKHYTCPVCDINFTARSVRAGKIKAEGKDSDLRPNYEFMDPLKYDAITCSCCGYSALSRYFGKVTTKQAKEIKVEIGASFKGIDDKNVLTYSYDDAILRHKLSVLCSIVKHSKSSERAYSCLKLAWVIRGKRITLKENDPQLKELYLNEMEALKNAYEGFMDAMLNESFPISGMDENTLKYLMADIARKLRRFDEASKLIGSVIVSRATNARLRDEALKEKEMIKEDMRKYPAAKPASN